MYHLLRHLINDCHDWSRDGFSEVLEALLAAIKGLAVRPALTFASLPAERDWAATLRTPILDSAGFAASVETTDMMFD